MSISFQPIAPWPILAIFASVVVFLTIWAYRQRLRGTKGGWRWIAFGLRLFAVLLCLIAALRPTINLPEKKKQSAAILLMIDRSKSLTISDEINGQSRWVVAKKALAEARKALGESAKDMEVKEFQFDNELREEKVDDKTQPEGNESALGSVLVEAVKRMAGMNIAAIVLISDGASNSGIPPLVAASQLKAKLVPVITVGVGEENAGAGSKDIAVRDLVVGPVVFVKNQPEIRGTISVRGFAGKPIDVELQVEGEGTVAKTTITAAEGAELVPITGLKYLPQIAGEKRVTLKVKSQDGELIKDNNEFTTYLTVLGGGLKVLYVHGTDFSWEPQFLTRALDAAKEIHVDLKVIRQPAVGDRGMLDDAEFAPGNYDVFIIGSLPANFLTERQQTLLATAVTKGAGLIMLGGRSSFGDGGWANSPVAAILPVNIRAGDGAVEPKEGLKFVPNPKGLQSYVLRLAPTPADSQRIWESLPPLPGANRFGQPKPLADVLATGGDTNEPLLIGMNTGQGRTLAFGGETWIWGRGGDEGRLAFLRFWRQSILWLAHKEDQGDSEVRLKLDRRRVAVGEKLEISAAALNPKKEVITDAEFTTTVTRTDDATGKLEPVQLFPQGEVAKGFYAALGKPGEYKVELSAKQGTKEIGRTSARFNVFQDDRELENPAADRKLLREIAEITGGQSVTTEALAKQLANLDTSATERVSLSEKRIWDNWIFFLIFTAVLTLEWWLRKRKGWV